MFQGYLQHDSQELLCCLLSQLQEASQLLLQVVKEEKEEKQRRLKHSKLSLTSTKSSASKTGVVFSNKSNEQEAQEQINQVSNGTFDKLKTEHTVQEVQNSSKASPVLTNGLTNGDALSSTPNENKCVLPQGSGEGGKGRKRTSSARDSDLEDGDKTPNPKRKVKRRSRSITPSSGTVVKSKTGKSSSKDHHANGSNGKPQTPVVNGNENHSTTNGKTASGESKVNSGGKKKRLGVGRMRTVPSNQPTVLSKFGFTKENGTPKNGIRGVVNGDHTLVNGETVPETKLKTSQGESQCTYNQSNNNSNPTQSSVPNSPVKSSKTQHDSKSPDNHNNSNHETNNNGKSAKLQQQPTDGKKSGCLETKPDEGCLETKLTPDASEEVECIGTVSNFEKYLQVVEKMFQGSLVLRTRCSECEGFTERREEFQDISVPVQKMEVKTEVDEEDHVPGK